MLNLEPAASSLACRQVTMNKDMRTIVKGWKMKLGYATQ
jgi:hypothetical protein